MSGTPEGGRKAAITNRARYGEDFYKGIGRAGGQLSKGGGFSHNPDLAREAGAKGGRKSKGGGRKPKTEVPKQVDGIFSRLFKERE